MISDGRDEQQCFMDTAQNCMNTSIRNISLEGEGPDME